jgi:hypothetical protein
MELIFTVYCIDPLIIIKPDPFLAYGYILIPFGLGLTRPYFIWHTVALEGQAWHYHS